uniref:Uncharacterized protein n=1 Tax=Zea mays TaxID=4577 RepID=C4J136_MAIZE|nr:unknown [Zea mays]
MAARSGRPPSAAPAAPVRRC